VDLMPSLLRLCGAEVPEGVQGGDYAHVFTGDEGRTADSVYLQILGPGWPKRVSWSFWRGLRTKRWTYARYKDDDLPTELFDNENDPYQMENLAFHPQCAEVRAELEKRLQEWMSETEDPFDTGPRDPESGILELGQRFIDDKYERWPQAKM
jgi:arylsulfatase A-like enzyme